MKNNQKEQDILEDLEHNIDDEEKDSNDKAEVNTEEDNDIHEDNDTEKKIQNETDSIKKEKYYLSDNKIKYRIILIVSLSIITIFIVTIIIIMKSFTNISEKSNKDKPSIYNFLSNNISSTEPQNDNNDNDINVYDDNISKILGDISFSDKEINEYKNKPIVKTSEVYSYDDMKEDLSIMYKLYYKYFTVNNHGTTADGRNLYEVIVGNPDAPKHILIHAGIHAREYVTSVLVMKQLENFLKSYNKTYKDIKYSDILNEIAFHIVPMVNPDGITISQSGISQINSKEIVNNLKKYYERDFSSNKIYTDFEGYLKIWKSNAIGTDINKNFNNDWSGYEGPVAPSRLNYKGSAPESEPETKALVSIVNNNNIVAAIAYHATGSVIYWDYNQEGVLRDKCYELASCVKNTTGYTIYSSSDIQLSQAGFSDWMVVVNHIPSLTVEVGRGVAPLPLEDFTEIWNDNSDVWEELSILYK